MDYVALAIVGAAMFLLFTSPLGASVLCVYCSPEYEGLPERTTATTGLTWDEYMTILRSAPRG